MPIFCKKFLGTTRRSDLPDYAMIDKFIQSYNYGNKAQCAYNAASFLNELIDWGPL